MFEKILIANRGEVAARLARTCRRLGIDTYGVHAEGEAELLHVQACDHAIEIGPRDMHLSYLSVEALVAAARKVEAHAVYVGYGGLAEAPELAQAVEEAGLIFVGPASERFRGAQDRLAVREAAREVAVRVLPATGALASAEEARAAILELGLPVVLKPVRGVGEPERILPVLDEEGLEAALGEQDLPWPLYAEQMVEKPRHIEVQVVSDGLEEVVVLGDRESSLRRDGRRLVSEAPAPGLDALHFGDAVRGALWEASMLIAEKLGCRGAGSCRFLLDSDGRFFFVDFHPGLTLEHATVEMCTGLDLVEIQLRLAAGEPMPERVRSAEASGAAVQARIEAALEPTTGRPFSGRVEALRWPPAPLGKVRINTTIEPGSVVEADHSPVVAAIATYASTRHEAILSLDRLIAETEIHPLVTNLRLLRRALNHESFRAGQYDETLLDGGNQG